MRGVVDSMVGGAGVVESMLSFRSVWEAESIIGVADFNMKSLKCDRGGRFLGWLRTSMLGFRSI